MEVYGASGSGKSEVLINVVAQYILPAWLGGEEQTAVYFDNGERCVTVQNLDPFPMIQYILLLEPVEDKS